MGLIYLFGFTIGLALVAYAMLAIGFFIVYCVLLSCEKISEWRYK